MRFTLAFTLAALIAGPAHAQIDTDFAEASRIFGQVGPFNVVDDIEGEWLPLTKLSNLNGAEPDPGLISSLIERFCNNDTARGAVFTRVDDASFEMVAANSGGELMYRFDWIGGAQFHRSFDPAAVFAAFKLDAIEGERGSELRARTLDGLSNLVNLYRITPDLLAMAERQRVEIYGRCPQ